jgi:3-oxoacyl-[acyl-carrier-protein] synthase III
MNVAKGRVLTVGTGENENKIKVAPIEDIDAVSPYYQVPAYLRTENIKKGDAVVFVSFGDGSGAILAKM